jgi:hypothetical protein
MSKIIYYKNNKKKNYFLILLIFYLLYTYLDIMYVNHSSWYNSESMLAFIAQHENFKFTNFSNFFHQLYISILEGEYYDTNTARFRPLSHFAELIDYSLKIPLFYSISINPNLNTFSVIICTIAIPFISFKIFISQKIKILHSILISLFILSLTSVLSTFYWSFRPAKRLLIIFSLLSFYFFSKNLNKNKKKYLHYGFLSNVALLLSDEEGFFLFYLFSTLFFFSIKKKDINTRKEWILINICLFLLVLLKLITNNTPTFGGKTLESSLLLNLFNIINFQKIFYISTEIFLNFNYATFGLIGKESFLIYLIYAIFLILPYFKKNNNLRFLSILFIVSFFLYILSNSILALIAGIDFMRPIGFYYGSSRFIFVLLFLFYLIKVFQAYNINLTRNKIFIFEIIISSSIFFITLLNLNYFKYSNMLIYNYHYEKINQKYFYENLHLIKNKKDCSVATEIKIENFTDNKKKINFEILKYLQIDNKFNIDLINNAENLTPVSSILNFYKTIDKCSSIK